MPDFSSDLNADKLFRFGHGAETGKGGFLRDFLHEFQAWIFLLLLKTIIMIPNRFSCEGDI